MAPIAHMSRPTHVLLEDPDLAAYMPNDRLAAAVRACVAPSIRVPVGPWSPSARLTRMVFGVGLLVLEGLLVRRVGVAGRFGAELLGDGDLLRPWQEEDAGASLPHSGTWRVLSPCRMAVLDPRFAAQAGRYPELIPAILDRAIRRARHMAVCMAIVHQPRVDVRLHMLLWDLADRWGTVEPDGVHVRVGLTHATLADLVAAQRQTVSKAIRELDERGLVRWGDGGWLLSGEPPVELQAVGAVRVKPQQEF